MASAKLLFLKAGHDTRLEKVSICDYNYQYRVYM